VAIAYAGSILAGLVAFAATAAVLDPLLRPSRTGESLAPGEDAAVRAALGDYQRIYQDFFASGGNPALLDEFPASKDVKHHIFRDVGFVRDAGLTLVQDLATLEVREVRRTGDELAEAVTFEEWNYVFQLAEGRKPASSLKGMGQGFRYRLRRTGGSWKVVGWDLTDVAAPARDEARRW
jgi:hypothetical protein